MAWEDLYWDINKEIGGLGLKKEFDKQLKKMANQDKHKYKDIRDRWNYAKNKVIDNNSKEKGNETK